MPNDRDELADDNAETPGREDCIEGPNVKWTPILAFSLGAIFAIELSSST
jgi:hypothetical protein